MILLGTILFSLCTADLSPVRLLNLQCPPEITRSIDPAAWRAGEMSLAVPKILRNVSPPNAVRGAVVAAPTRFQPNYFYHWVRDAGLVMDALATVYRTASPTRQQLILGQFKNYVEFSRGLQTTKTLTGLGEPKFNPDGSAFNEPWARPQNDSPALRAISLMHWARELGPSHDAFIRSQLESLITKDLDYIARVWAGPSFDLWEEVSGDHFYTRMVQRRALHEGAKFLARQGQASRGQNYERVALLIEKDLLHSFWNPKDGILMATLNRRAGLDYKLSRLDSAVVLGVLQGTSWEQGDTFLAPNDPRVQSTIARLNQAFRKVYPVNQDPGLTEPLIGRYPEDRYSGADAHGGNPWPLCTLAMAEIQYRAARLELKAGRADRARELVAEGDGYFAAVKRYAHPDGSLNEQIDRTSGQMTSVEDLTWNYAAIITAQLARPE